MAAFDIAGKTVLVDDADLALVSRWKWYISNLGYVVRRQHVAMVDGKRVRRTVYLHRLLNQTPDGFDTDHVNRNKLDNRRSNLRSVAHQENLSNRGLFSNNTSGYTGVVRAGAKWGARVVLAGKRVHIGVFSTALEAFNARKAYLS